MALLNYTTSIDAEKTVAEIQKLLAKKGAKAILTEYDDDGNLSAVSFRFDYNGNLLSFLLPARVDNIYKILCKTSPKAKYKTMDQAHRVAWRIIKDWIEAQIALIEAEQADLAQVFLPYVQNPTTGKTLYESLNDNGVKLLGYEH